MEACNYGRNGCVLLLHKASVPSSTEDLSGLTALHWAVLGGHSDTVELLLSTVRIPVSNLYIIFGYFCCDFNFTSNKTLEI